MVTTEAVPMDFSVVPANDQSVGRPGCVTSRMNEEPGALGIGRWMD